jgi:chemotaxis protein MotB
MSLRMGDQQMLGGVVYFSEESDELTEAAKKQLQLAADEIGGKPQKIEIRGHTSRRPIGKDGAYRDNWDLAYARCRSTMEFLLSLNVQKDRIRLSVASEHEPRFSGIDANERARNARVEVFMLNERVSDLVGEETLTVPGR